MGRPGARTGGGVDHQAETRWTPGLCHTDMQHIASDGAAGGVPAAKRTDAEASQLLGSVDGHPKGVGRQHEEATETAMPTGDSGGPGQVAALGKAERHGVRPNT